MIRIWRRDDDGPLDWPRRHNRRELDEDGDPTWDEDTDTDTDEDEE